MNCGKKSSSEKHVSFWLCDRTRLDLPSFFRFYESFGYVRWKIEAILRIGIHRSNIYRFEVYPSFFFVITTFMHSFAWNLTHACLEIVIYDWVAMSKQNPHKTPPPGILREVNRNKISFGLETKLQIKIQRNFLLLAVPADSRLDFSYHAAIIFMTLHNRTLFTTLMLRAHNNILHNKSIVSRPHLDWAWIVFVIVFSSLSSIA